MLEFSNKSINPVIAELLTFNSLPTIDDVEKRVEQLVEIAKEESCKNVLIDCELFLVTALELNLRARGINPLYKHKDINGNESLVSSFFEIDEDE